MSHPNHSRDHGHKDEQPPATMSIEEAAKLMRIGRSTCYRAAEEGLIPVIRIGRRIQVITAKLYEMLGLNYEGGAEAA